MKIAFVMDSFFPIIDGVSMVMDKYARIMTELGHELHLLVPKVDAKIMAKYPDYKDDYPYRVHRCKAKLNKMIGYMFSKPNKDKPFLQEIAALDLDLIHVHSPFFMGKFGVKLARKRGIPVVGTFHTLFKKDIKRFLKLGFIASIGARMVAKLFRKCDEVWSMNDACKRELFSYGYRGAYRQMNNGTEMRPLPDIDERVAAVKREYGLEGRPNIFMFIGRTVKQKNIFFLADALKLLKDRGVDYKMVFVGDGLDKPALEKYADKLGIADRTVFTGMISDRDRVAAVFASSTLFLFPSLYDTNSLVQIEAACYGVPTVFIDGTVTSHLVTDGVNGYKAPGSVAGYADKVMEILSDPKTYKDVSKGAKEQIYITWDTIVGRALDAYGEVIDNYNAKKQSQPQN